MTRSLIIVKPDGVSRGLVGEIISRFEKRNYSIYAIKMIQISRELAEEHYREHVGKVFFEELVSFITSGPVVVAVLEGESAVDVIRSSVGATNPQDANPGTIRGDFGNSIAANIIHASDSEDSAKREINLFFGR